jgi:D-alanine-D-alanine ligase
MKIAIVQNSDRSGNVIGRFGQPCPEKYGRTTIQRVLSALQSGGHEVRLIEGDTTMFDTLRAFMPPVDGRPGGLVMNMAYGIQGDSRYTHVPAMLEMAGVPYTGATPTGHALALDKKVTKDLIRSLGVATPAYTLMRQAKDPCDLRFPLIVKPRHESTSYGVRLVTTRAELREAVEAVVSAYRQDVLVEEYIDGREFCVGLLGNHPLRCLPVVEQDFGGRDVQMLTKGDKFHKTPEEPVKRCPAPIKTSLQRLMFEMSRATFRACQLRDYARADLRIDKRGQPFMLEINSMASLGAGGSFVLAASHIGLDYDALVLRIVDEAHRRYFGVPAPRPTAVEELSLNVATP